MLTTFSWLHFYSRKKTPWQKKYEEVQEELAAAMEQRKKYQALSQEREDEHLEMIKNMKRRIDALEGKCQVSAYVYI